MSENVYVEAAAPGDPQQAAEGIERLFAHFPAADLPKAGTRVLLKPNLLAKHPPGRAVTTHPDVLRGVILALQKRGVTEITVADSPGGPYSPGIMAGVYKTCGLSAVCAETGAKLYTSCESAEIDYPSGKLVRHFSLLKPVAEADYIINLPKLKTHVLTGMSGGVKNLLGCVPGLSKAEFHMRFPERELFGQMLVDLCECIKPNLHIVDGILGMEGDGPAGGDMREVGLLFASRNPYYLDLTLCRYMGLDTQLVPTLVAAAENGLCGLAFDEEMLVANAAARQPIEHFTPPSSCTGRVDFSSRLPRFMRGIVPVVSRFVAPHPVVNRKSCIGCGKCAEICPRQVIAIQNSKAHIGQKNCIRCFCCHEMCPVKAIHVRKTPLFRL